jgi:hypothetical protein
MMADKDKGGNDASKVAAVVAFYFVVSISLVYSNKVLFSSEGTSLDAPLFVTWCVSEARHAKGALLSALAQVPVPAHVHHLLGARGDWATCPARQFFSPVPHAAPGLGHYPACRQALSGVCLHDHVQQLL